MTTDMTEHRLPGRIRELLATAPASHLPMTYQGVAEALALTPPRTIRRVAEALEALMKEDARYGRPFIAALVVSRQGAQVPGAGFFELAVALGRFPTEATLHAEAYRQERYQAMQARRTPTH
ncbi:hypothetical protein ACUN9Y_12535 [Halomonas sp. V046]|uniref:hypothetical protein n=1 Tax=Halomonas sp. V046 TaxID=3459611 RepID=UPI0040446F90